MTWVAHPVDVDEDLGAFLQYRLDEEGMTVSDLADATGIGVLALEHRLAGEAPWWLSEVVAACRVLGIEPARVFDEI